MSSLSYLYTSTNTGNESFNLATITAPDPRILTVTTGAGFATIGVATPGTDYIVDLSTQTGLIIGTPTDEGVLPINFPTDGAATGSLLVYNSSLGSGEYVPFPVGASGDVLTATTVSPTHPLGLTWSPSGGGGSGANWSLYPALADVDMYSFVSPNPLTYYGIRRAQYLTFEPLNDNYPADTNPALWVTPGVAGNPPSLVYGTNIDGEIITQTVVTSVENSTYGSQGSLLIGIGGGYAPTAVGSVGQVLTVQNVEGEGITPIWAPPIVIPPHLTVDCVVWIQNWQTIILQGGGNITPIWPTYTNGIPSAAYTYANGISGVGATITFNSAGSFVAADSDNISLSLNSRILFVDNTSNGVANGIYKVTTLGTGSVAMVWQRTTDFDTPAQILDGVPIFVKGGTVFGGQTVTFSTSSAVTIGTTPLLFSTNVFSTSTMLLISFPLSNVVGPPNTNIPLLTIPAGGRIFVPIGAPYITYNNDFPIGTESFNLNIGSISNADSDTFLQWVDSPINVNTNLGLQLLFPRVFPFSPIPSGTAKTWYFAASKMISPNQAYIGDCPIVIQIDTLLPPSSSVLNFYIPGQWIN